MRINEHPKGYLVMNTNCFSHYCEGGPLLDNGTDLRDVFAENMQHLIMKCLE